MNIGIGLDTGGTYTDAVLYDFDTESILGTAKALTTREDLTRGILAALDMLPQALVRQARVIALSTTLATNACVEDRGGRAKLIFIGARRKVIAAYGQEYGLPPVEDILLVEGVAGQRTLLNEQALNNGLNEGFDDLDGVGIVDIDAVHNSAVREKRARELFEKRFDLPVICGHELFQELNSLQRAASTLLNARLVPVIREFLSAIRTALAARGILATVVIVRSDGGLMSEEFAHIRPVETLLSGPAASVLGSAQLTRQPNCVVVDMGGTTTDIALVENNLPVQAVDGVRVGKWKTFVSGLFVRTFGLGGDTCVHYHNGQMQLETYRVMPLCALAAQHPQVLDNLRALVNEEIQHTTYLHEHYVLVREAADTARYSKEEQAFCEALRQGPLSHGQLAQVVPGQDVYNLNVSRLVHDGVIAVAGLTPTDIMHVRGDFTGFSVEAATLAAQFVARNLSISVQDLCNQVYDEIKRRLYVNIVAALLMHQDEHYRRNGLGSETERLIHQCYEQARDGQTEPLSLRFTTRFVLTGVGAPTAVFLPEVARLLGTHAEIPEHHEVANALGAVVGQVVATQHVDIRPILDIENPNAYRVYGHSRTRDFKDKAEAQAFAMADAQEAARAEALRRGAQDIAVTVTLADQQAQAHGSAVYLGTRVVAQAVGGVNVHLSPR